MPEISQVHIDTALTDVSVGYGSPEFVAEQVAPTVPVRKQSDKYFIYDSTREVLRAQDDARAPGAEANEVDFQMSNDSYFCNDHALESIVPDEERDNADSPIQPEIDKTEFLTNVILLNQEVALVAKLVAGITANAAAGVVFTTDTSTPLVYAKTARLAVMDAIQKPANTIVVDNKVYEALAQHPEIIDRIKYSTVPGNPALATKEALAKLFLVDRFLVSAAVKNTAAKDATASVSAVWGTTMFFLHVPPRAGLKVVAAALTFAWNAPGANRGVTVETWRDNPRKGNMVRVQKYYDQKIVAALAGYRLTGCIS